MLWYSICRLYKTRIVSLITIGMLAIGLIIMIYASVVYEMSHQSEILAKKIFIEKTDDIYNINFFKYIYANTEDKHKLKELYEYIKSLPEIKYCGMYFYGENELFITKDLLKLCIADLDIINDENMAIVGFGKKEKYQVGSFVRSPYTQYSCMVGGYLMDGALFIGDQYINSGGDIQNLDDFVIYDFDDLINCDVEYITNAMINNFYFVIDYGQIEKVKELINNKSNELGIDIYGINNMTELFKQNIRESMERAGEQYYMPIMAFVCSLVGMFLATLISYRVNRQDVNVMLVNGYSRRDLGVMILFENLIKYIFAYVICVFYWKNNDDVGEYFSTVDINEILIYVLIASGVMVVLSTMPIILKVAKTKPISLIHE